ncbi:MAG TPA: 3,4-dihydroxy-2-butanone-4-phosphate synthase, partial [Saprospiraceae bacterium]|nr:3,4-dihydroxy-2-butanone-4-phosphate synthase [Saprospiraceae bacterium]
YARPGHIFPLIAKNGGVLRRTGHTEATVDLARLAGYYPAGVLVEILNADGTMARLPQLLEIAERFKLKIITIKDLVAYRMRTESIVQKEKHKEITTEFGKMEIHPYRDITSSDVHYAIKMGDWNSQQPVLVRVQTINSYIELLQQFLNPVNNDFNKSLKAIAAAGSGLFLVMKQNDHILDGIKELKHLDQVFGNCKTSHDERPMGQRDFGVGAQIIRDMGVKKIKLITHSPLRRIALEGYGLEIVDNEVI